MFFCFNTENMPKRKSKDDCARIERKIRKLEKKLSRKRRRRRHSSSDTDSDVNSSSSRSARSSLDKQGT